MTSRPDNVPAVGTTCFLLPTSGKPCVAGPGKRPIPAAGCNHVVDLFLVRRVLDGSLIASPFRDDSTRNDQPAPTRVARSGAEKKGE
jgi:hypothetical protein